MTRRTLREIAILLLIAALVPARAPSRAPSRSHGSALAARLLLRSARADDDDDDSDSGDAADDSSDDSSQAHKKSFRRSRLTSDETEGLADRRELLLTVGVDKVVDLDFDVLSGDKCCSIGNPTVVATQLVKIGTRERQIVFKPLKHGDSTVTIRDTDGTVRIIFFVRVTDSSLSHIADEVKDLLRDVEGVDVRIVGPKIILEGEVLVPADFGRISIVANDPAYKDFILNLTTLSPLGLQILSKRIQQDINSFAPAVTTRVVNGVIFLEGSVPNAEYARRADSIAQVYLPEVRPETLLDRDKEAQRPSIPRRMIMNFIQIEPPQPKKRDKLVRVTIHFVELTKDYEKFFGFKWAPGFTADPTIQIGQAPNGTTAAGGTSFSATISSLIPKLESAQDAGYARTLKTATVIVRSGQPASVDEETQYPFVVAGPNGVVSPGSQPVGLSLGVTPVILGQSEDIQMEIKMNQIDLTSPGTSTSPPVTTTHKVDTRIYVKSKESAAIAGVNDSSITTDFNKNDPDSSSSFNSNGTSGTDDAIFTLLHSKNYSKNKSQFVIFVTPEIIENASDGSEDLKKNFRVRAR